ncbi:uncharacterized protein SCHCODRAFT_02517320 [Schizophyllum commune H4-8]|uniref:uncharacterized protein n=1 Tax=Schizophyllum commune (strain H4-8 / FGSC 9210) TaxID=578458 RepID=UPI002161062D|nr:uncharacterized protein SCHCODRAFT_02517320 [Schizophyllum commune H4-8]KAI5886689.1 hypothetical protein SCHCODRAFT_02517320 [Schizophyllum commune H4-8]
MSYGSLFLGITAFWILVHATNQLYLSRSEGSTLPAFAPRRRRTGNITVSVDRLHLRVQTTRLNSVHDLFAQWSSKNLRLRRVLSGFYNLGTAACCMGVLTALGLLLWTTWGLLSATFSATTKSGLPPPDNTLTKRDTLPPEPSSSTATSSFGIRPLIPGVTVPMSHLPLMLLAVLVGQIVHEMGHAAASALEQIHITSAGLSILVLFPSAFVALPTSAIEALSARARLHIIAGGPYHNLCYFVALWTARWIGVFAVLAPISGTLAGYEDISALGRVVVGVDEGSNLHAYIPRGAILTHLDDVKLDSATAWDEYFTAPSSSKGAMGWCVPRRHVADAPTDCCDPSLFGVPSTLACFVEWGGGGGAQACLNPVPLLGNPRSPRCDASAPCADEATCAQPSDAAHLVRICMQAAAGPSEEIVIWNGEREEVREAVQTSTWRPRLFFLPLGLPSTVEALLQYLELATLSLFLFNLLPLPMLDGEQFLRSLLDLVLGDASPYDEYDVAALEDAEAGFGAAQSTGGRTSSGSVRRRRSWRPQDAERWKERVCKGATTVTMGSLGTCVVLGMAQSVR